MISSARWPALALVALLGACGEKGKPPSNPLITFSIFQSASVVIGQVDFLHNEVRTSPAADTINSPSGRTLVSGDKLYLPDSSDHRLLVYDPVPTTNDTAANMVLGQPSFEVAVPGTTAAQFRYPGTVLTESGKLLVVDTANSRVMFFSPAPMTSGSAANLVIGWDDFSKPAVGCAQNRLNFPASIFTVNGKLLVADEGNHRVLIWNSISTISNGTPADLVLGQSGFAQCDSNAGKSVVDGSTLNSPSDVWSDGTRVVVVDSSNNRVLIWSKFPTTSGATADLVLGQADLTSIASGCSQTRLASPRSVSSNGTQLFVADKNNHRVLIWNSFPVKNGAPADVVLGQGDFMHSAANDDDQISSTNDPFPTARTLKFPVGIALWGKQLFVTDTGNNRYLIFNGQ